jgi:phospholipid-binding lipoprotein MlaA
MRDERKIKEGEFSVVVRCNHLLLGVLGCVVWLAFSSAVAPAYAITEAQQEEALLDLDASTDVFSMEVSDPLESLNRFTHGANQWMDGLVFRPIAELYSFMMPSWAKQRLRLVLHNLKHPLYSVQHLLQGEWRTSLQTLARFGVNSSVGLAGVFDPATRLGLPAIPTDGGISLARYCAAPGPYLVLPVLGPSTLRDAVGLAADTVIDPVPHALSRLNRRWLVGIRALDNRESLLEVTRTIDSTALDHYTSTRQLYAQNRQYQVRQAMERIRRGQCLETRPFGMKETEKRLLRTDPAASHGAVLDSSSPTARLAWDDTKEYRP